MSTRKEFLAGIAGFAAGKVLDITVPTVAHAEEAKAEAPKSWINWSGYERTGIPEGEPGKISPLAMVSAVENLVAVTAGAVEFTDKLGKKAEWSESHKIDATYLIINDGEGITVGVPATYAWVGVSPKPNGAAKLTSGQMTEVSDERKAAIRKFQPNTKNLNVLWVIDGLVYMTGNYTVR